MNDVHKNIRALSQENPHYEIQVLSRLGNMWGIIPGTDFDPQFTYRLVDDHNDLVMESHGISDQKVIKANPSPATPQSDLTPNDPVAHPGHYTQGSVECIDAMVSAFGESNVRMWAQLNAFKYIWRHERKGDDEDIRKAIWYLRYSLGDDPRK